jgi:serine/threonine protein kinase
MAPESIITKTYSSKSDVWAFGVTMVEIMTQDAPYPEEEGLAVVIGVTTQGRTPETPASCPASFADTLRQCWAFEPVGRPDFTDMFSVLAGAEQEFE